MRLRERFVCQSAACRRETEIALSSNGGAGQFSNPRCACGSEMKKAYSKPVFRELSKAEAILRLGDSGPPKTSAQNC